MTKLQTPVVLLSWTNNLIGKSHFLTTPPPKKITFGPYSLKIIIYLLTSFQNRFSSYVNKTLMPMQRKRCVFATGIVLLVTFYKPMKEPNSGKSVFPIPISPFPVEGLCFWQPNAHSKHICSPLWKSSPTVLPLFCVLSTPSPHKQLLPIWAGSWAQCQ